MATDQATIHIAVEPTVTAVDDSVATQVGQAVTVPVLANDTVNGAPATVAELDGPPIVVDIRPAGAGAATVDPVTGDVEFTPAEGFCGPVQVDYEIERTCATECPTLILTSGRLTREGYPGGLPGFEFGVTGMFSLWAPGTDVGGGEALMYLYQSDSDEYTLFNDGEVPCVEDQEGWQVSYETGSTPPSLAVECIIYTNQCA